jgi:hypothetical protein
MDWRQKCAAKIADAIESWPAELCRLVVVFSVDGTYLFVALKPKMNLICRSMSRYTMVGFPTFIQRRYIRRRPGSQTDGPVGRHNEMAKRTSGRQR